MDLLTGQLEDELVAAGLLIHVFDLKDDCLDFGLCSPNSNNPVGVDEDWMGTETGTGATALQNYKRLITTYCQQCPVRSQCFAMAVVSKSYQGVFGVHPKHRKKRVLKAQIRNKRTFRQMFKKLDRALNNLEELD